MRTRLKAALCFVLVFTTAISSLVFSTARSASACPIPIAVSTIYDLYNSSSLIVTAELESLRDGRVVVNEEYYKTIEVTRNLRVISVHKGVPPERLSYKQIDVRHTDERPSEPTRHTDNYGYQGFSGLAVGEKYLFFLTNEAGSREYKLTDLRSGIKWLDDHSLAIHEKRIAELADILQKPKDKGKNLTAWAIRMMEDPATLWDGTFELFKSNAAEIRKSPDDDSSAPRMLFSMGKGDPVFIENLTDSQKEYISTLAFQELDQMLNSESYLSNYGTASLASSWDKARLAEYLISRIPDDIESDVEKTARIVDAATSLIDDEVLWDLSYHFTTDPDPEPKPADESKPVSETRVADADDNDAIKPADESKPVDEEDDGEDEEEVDSEFANLRPSKVRAAVVQKLRAEFGFLIANNFQRPAAEEESEN